MQKPEGWTLNSITTEGVPVANPRGFFNILYSAGNVSHRVWRDLDGKNFTFYPLRAVKLSDRSIQFNHSLPLAEIESIWEIDTDHLEAQNSVIIEAESFTNKGGWQKYR